MSAETKKYYGLSLVLLALGVLSLYVGARWLVLLIPAGALVWFAAAPKLRRGRN